MAEAVIRANSTEDEEAGNGLARRHRTAVFVSALVVSAVCFALLPGETFATSLAQGALLVAVTLVAVGLSHPRVLGTPACRGECRGWRAWIGYVLAVGLVAGIASAFSLSGINAAEDLPARVVQVLALCVLTGVFEEGIFRVLAMDAFAPAFGDARGGLLKAALASSFLFGLLHASFADAVLTCDAVVGMQVVLKPVQAGLFGFFMAGVYVATRNLWVLALVHGVFNAVCIGPRMVADGLPQTYVTGSFLDLAVLMATVVLLVPPVVFAYRTLRRNG